MNVTCPHCKAVLTAPPEAIGQLVDCGRCKKDFVAKVEPAGPPPPIEQEFKTRPATEWKSGVIPPPLARKEGDPVRVVAFDVPFSDVFSIVAKVFFAVLTFIALLAVIVFGFIMALSSK